MFESGYMPNVPVDTNVSVEVVVTRKSNTIRNKQKKKKKKKKEVKIPSYLSRETSKGKSTHTRNPSTNEIQCKTKN